MTVIAIGAVLTALLLPALKGARNSADRAKCMGILRSWGVSFQMYASDNNGFYPLSWLVDESSNGANYTVWMAPYVENNWIVVDNSVWSRRLDKTKCGCPTLARYNHPTDPNYREMPYAYNAVRMDYPYNPNHHIKGIAGVYGPFWVPGTTIMDRYGGESAIYNYWRVPQTQLYKHPERSIVMFCGICSHWRNQGFVNGLTNPPSDDDWDAKTGAGNLVKYGQASVYDNDAAVAGVHNGNDNFLFMDGHVQTMASNDPQLNYDMYNLVPNPTNPYNY